MRAYCLSIHAGYGCEHSGACCTAGWPIPIDAGRVSRLRQRGLISSATGAQVRTLAEPVDGLSLVLGQDAGGACAFLDADRQRCRIHRDAGTDLLPVSCRNFPRVALHDARGLFITLSHFCPTAASLLLHARTIAIVDAPASISLAGRVEGLDARDVLPPLLAPGMLMDPDGYSAWEREALAVLDAEHYSAGLSLAVIRAATVDACRWRPGGDLLAVRVRQAFERARLDGGRGPAVHTPMERPIKAFLAAHLFASWAAYEDGGLAGILHAVESAFGMLGSAIRDEASFIAAVRAADLRLRHQGDHVRSEPVPALRRG